MQELSLRLGHRTGLTVHRTVIQYRSAASLPPQGAFRRNSAIGSGSCGPALKESLRISEKEFDFEFSVKPEVTGNKIPEIEYGKLV